VATIGAPSVPGAAGGTPPQPPAEAQPPPEVEAPIIRLAPLESQATPVEDALWELFRENSATFLLFSEEKGEQGTVHYQGVCSFSCRKELKTLKKISPKIHWEIRRGTLDEAIAYCSKPDSHIRGPFEYGDRSQGAPAQGRRTDLEGMARAVREGGLVRLAEEDPGAIVRYGRGLQLYQSLQPVTQTDDNREVILLFGMPGCGKTRTYFTNEGPAAPMLDATSGYWFDGYMGEPSVLLDDFDGNRSKWGLSQLLNLLDRYNRRVPIKGGFTQWIPKRIYVSTNFHPRDWYDWSSRELQYPALIRRFTSVLHWKRLGGPPVEYRRDGVGNGLDQPSDFQRFFNGREALQRNLDVASGKIVAKAPTMDYYDF